jgi:hypothetical protein
MVKHPIKKGRKKEAGAPVIELPQARIKILEAAYEDDPDEVTPDNGAPFTPRPGMPCKLHIVDDYDDGTWDGAQWYERFSMQEDGSGGWEVRPGGKLGALISAHPSYGPAWFEDEDAGIDPDDFVGFEFQSKLEQKHYKGKLLEGTVCNQDTIMAVPKPKKKKKGLSQAQQEAAEAANQAEVDELPYDELTPEEEQQMNQSIPG